MVWLTSCRVKSRSYNRVEQLEASLGNWIEKQQLRMDIGIRGIRSG